MKDIMFVKMSQVEMPKIIESLKKDFVLWGEDNNFPQSLIDYYQKSSLHNAIIKSKVNDIIGDGLTYEGKTDKKTDIFIEYVNPYETLNDILRKIAYDLTVFGGFALNIIWGRDQKTISEIYHIDMANVRCGIMNEKKQVEYYLYSEKWNDYRPSYKQIPAYNPMKADLEPSQLLYYKSYNPGLKYYPLPSYVGALTSIETDIEINNFHLAHIKNGMTPNIMISFVDGVPTQDEMKAIEKQIKNKYVGTDNAGKFMVTFSSDKDKAPVIQTISPAQLDKQFIQLQDTVLQNILSGHGVVSPLLVGIPTPVGLGGTNMIKEAWELYHNRVINPFKTEVLSVINKIMSVNKMKELSINTSSPVSFSFSENILKEILTLNEMREMIGYDSVEESNNIGNNDDNDNINNDVNNDEKPEASPTEENITDEGTIAQISLNGAQIASLLQIVTAVSMHQLEYESAITLIVSAFPFNDKIARDILGNPENLKPTEPEQK